MERRIQDAQKKKGTSRSKTIAGHVKRRSCPNTELAEKIIGSIDKLQQLLYRQKRRELKKG